MKEITHAPLYPMNMRDAAAMILTTVDLGPDADGAHTQTSLNHAQNPNTHNSALVSAPRQVYRDAANEATVHALVYSIADQFRVPGLKELALAKFKPAVSSLTMDEFLQLAEIIYNDTAGSKDELHDELFAFLTKERAHWLSNAIFSNSLVFDDRMNVLTGALMMTMAQRLHDSGLEDASARNAARSEVAEARTTCDELRKHNTALQIDLKQAESDATKSNDQIVGLQGRETSLRSRKLETDAELKTIQAELKATIARLKTAEDSARAHSNASQSFARQLREEQVRTVANAAAATSERQRADRGVNVVMQIVRLVNRFRECDCGEEFNFVLIKDDRAAEYPFGSMLKCKLCKDRYYGDLV